MWGVSYTKERRQIDPIECGAVCLGMILDFLGIDITNAELRNVAKTSRNGSDASSIIEAARQYGMHAEAKRVSAHELQRGAHPAILFFDHSHFVVYEGKLCGRTYINDPARGRYSLDNAELIRRFSGVVINFSFTRKQVLRGHFARLISHMRKDLSSKIAFALTGIVTASFLSMLAQLTGLLLQGPSGLSNEPFNFMSILVVIMIIVCGVAIWQSLQAFAHRRLTQGGNDFLSRLKNISPSLFDDLPFFSVAEAFTLTSNNAFIDAQALMGYFYVAAFVVLMSFIGGMSPTLALITLASSTLFFTQRLLSKQVTQKSTDRALHDALSHAHDMRSMGQENILVDNLVHHEFFTLLYGRHKKHWWHEMLLSPLWPLTIFTMIFALYARASWITGALSGQQIISSLIATFFAVLVLPGIMGIRRREGGGEDILAEMAHAQKLEVQPATDASFMAMKNVSFAFRGEERKIITDLNFALEPGQFISVVGEPSSGATTFMRIVGGKLSPSSGTIVRPQKIAIIDEESTPFASTLRENITLLDDTITEQDIVRALNDACATSLFYDHPGGLLTRIDERGVNLSESERKCLLLAQALAHDPDLLILDDFFAALDEKIAKTIMKNLKDRGIAVIFTSFDEELLAKSDGILFLGQDIMPERSSHQELFKNNARYQNLIFRRLSVQP